MRKVIYKYEVGVDPITIPGGRILHVGTQDSGPLEGLFVWIQHDLGADGGVFDHVKMQLKAVGTGHKFDEDGRWEAVGSAQFESMPIVLHVLQKILWDQEEK